jgi:hypothetical protein
MTKKVKNYGFNTVVVNGLTVFSFGALFSMKNRDVLYKHDVLYNITSSDKLNVEFATTNANEMSKFSQKVGKAMKEIAQRDLESKYFWVEK